MWPYRSSLLNTFIGPFFFQAPENPSAGSNAASPATGFCAYARQKHREQRDSHKCGPSTKSSVDSIVDPARIPNPESRIPNPESRAPPPQTRGPIPGNP